MGLQLVQQLSSPGFGLLVPLDRNVERSLFQVEREIDDLKTISLG